MKTLGITSAAVLSLLLASAAPAFGQGQQDRRDHPEQQQAKQAPKQEQHAKPEGQLNQERDTRQGRSNPSQPTRADQHPQQQAQQQQSLRQQKMQSQSSQQLQHDRKQQAQQQQINRTRQAQQHSQQRIQQAAWQQHRAINWQTDHRNWQQRGGYHGYRIPDDRYRGYFGPDHRFRINGLPFLVVGGYPRFQYQGYWVSAVDPWPQEWASNWYDTDDVYLNYVDNGYYLYNRRYPNQGIAVNIFLR